MKKFIFISLLILVLLIPAAASAGDNIKVLIDGQEYNFDPTPIIIEGSTLVPMRSFFESLGADVYWEPETRTAVGIRNDVEVRIQIDCSTLTVNGIETTINVPAKLINGRTFIPLRFVGEALGDDVKWDHLKSEIIIETNTEEVEEAEEAEEAEEVEKVSAIYNDDETEEVQEVQGTEIVEEEVKVVYSEMGEASWYGSECEGNRTASGEIFDPYDFTAAHLELPFNTYVKVTFLQTGKSIMVRINDRGPHIRGRIIDLSKAAAEAIGLKGPDIGEVLLEVFE